MWCLSDKISSAHVLILKRMTNFIMASALNHHLVSIFTMTMMMMVITMMVSLGQEEDKKKIDDDDNEVWPKFPHASFSSHKKESS